MSDRRDLYERMTKQAVYFSNDFEDAVIKSLPGVPGYFVKFKGEKEFKAKTGSGVVTEALLEGKEITEEEYDNF